MFPLPRLSSSLLSLAVQSHFTTIKKLGKDLGTRLVQWYIGLGSLSPVST